MAVVTWEERADLAEAMVPLACELAVLVHDADADGIAAFTAGLTLPQAEALLVVLAAMVPVDERSQGELLAWASSAPEAVKWRQMPLILPAGGRPVTEGCGTYAAWVRHRRHGEDPDRACAEAMRAYKREHHRKAATGAQAA